MDYLSPGDPILGAREFTGLVDRVEEKRQLRDWLLNRNTYIMNGAAAEKWRLDQQVDRMQEMLDVKNARDAAKAANKKLKSGAPGSSDPTYPKKTLKRKSKSSRLSSSCTSKDGMERIQSRPGSLSPTSSKQHLNESTSSGTPPRT